MRDTSCVPGVLSRVHIDVSVVMLGVLVNMSVLCSSSYESYSSSLTYAVRMSRVHVDVSVSVTQLVAVMRVLVTADVDVDVNVLVTVTVSVLSSSALVLVAVPMSVLLSSTSSTCVSCSCRVITPYCVVACIHAHDTSFMHGCAMPAHDIAC